MKARDKISILLVDSGTHAEEVRQLLKSFFGWHLHRHGEDEHLIRKYFDKASFEKELDELPGKYGPPDGSLLLAYHDGVAAGCVALKRIGPESCEMKRMFVYEKFQGLGVGRRLAMEIVKEAKKLGYKKMNLDTSFRQVEAMRLYESIGFRKCEPYYQMPAEVENWLVFMELEL